MPTLAQRRAKDALEKVTMLETDPRHSTLKHLYAQTVVDFPATVVMNGFGQALATLLTKGRGDSPEGLLYRHLQAWLCGRSDLAPFPGNQDLMSALLECDRRTYMQAQAEALAWLDWLKKFSVAYLKN